VIEMVERKRKGRGKKGGEGGKVKRGCPPSESPRIASAGFSGRRVSPPIFDPAEALARCAGQRDILGEMVSFYLDHVAAWIDEMRAAAGTGAVKDLTRLVHRLRSTLVYLAAPVAEEAADKVEQLGIAGDMRGGASALATLIVSLGALETALRAWTTCGT